MTPACIHRDNFHVVNGGASPKPDTTPTLGRVFLLVVALPFVLRIAFNMATRQAFGGIACHAFVGITGISTLISPKKSLLAAFLFPPT
jgi:hypothetical protein